MNSSLYYDGYGGEINERQLSDLIRSASYSSGPRTERHTDYSSVRTDSEHKYKNDEEVFSKFIDLYPEMTKSLFSSSNPTRYESEVERHVIDARHSPIRTAQREQTSVAGYTGIYLNKDEADSFKGSVPLSNYPINTDFRTADRVYKRNESVFVRNKDVEVKYLKPKPRPPAKIHIIQEPDRKPEPAPPVVIRVPVVQQEDLVPEVIREMPPTPPPEIKPKVIFVAGKQQAPVQRRVIIELVPEVSVNTKPLRVERWLQYEPQKRDVVFHQLRHADGDKRDDLSDCEDSQKSCDSLEGEKSSSKESGKKIKFAIDFTIRQLTD